MASIAEGLYTLFRNEPSLTALLGTNPFRYTPDVIPQGTVIPASSYQQISDPPYNTLEKTSNLHQMRMQVTVWANTAASRQQVSDAFTQFVRVLSAQWKDGTRSRYVSGVRFGAITTENVVHVREAASAMYQAMIDFVVYANTPN